MFPILKKEKERAAAQTSKTSKISPKPQMRQCWAADKDKEDRQIPIEKKAEKTEKLTSFKNLKENLKNDDRADSINSTMTTSSMASSWCSWFIPTDENPDEDNIER